MTLPKHNIVQLVGQEGWDKFTKRELMAIRFAERLLDAQASAYEPLTYMEIGTNALLLADIILEKLLPHSDNDVA